MPRRAIDWTFEDLQTQLASNEQEHLMLDYKASEAVGDWTDAKRNELAKDVCAFANAEGGHILIGIAEDAHTRKPSFIDHGVNTALVSKEAIESALMSRVAPRVEGMTIKEIPNPTAPGYAFFVFGIPRSMDAPHMHNPTHRYYKRYNFQCLPMEHYEVEDIRRRLTEPQLKVRCLLGPAGEPAADGRTPHALKLGVLNTGTIVVRDVLVRLYLPQSCIGDGAISWRGDGVHGPTEYRGRRVFRLDAHLRDEAGPLPIYPHDDQPLWVTNGRGRKVTLHLPAALDPGDALIAQVFADAMRMRQFEFPVGSILAG
jgi:hypothetical protein